MVMAPQEASQASVLRERVPKRALPYSMAGLKWLPDGLSRRIFGKPLAPEPDEWRRIEAALWQGDPPMDAVVAWMFEEGPSKTKALFEQALKQGIETLENPPPALKAFFEHIENAPPWLDRALLNEAPKIAQVSGMASFYVLRDMALMGGYVYFNSMNQTLAATGSLRKNVALRLGETGKWLAEVTKPHGLERFNDGFITTIQVRLVHSLVRRALQKRGDWDADAWGQPINQVDMMATYLAFGPVTAVGTRIFGVPVTRRDSRAMIHMWRYIGWLMGVDESWLATTEGDGFRKLYHAFLTHRLPDEKVHQLGSVLMREPLSRRLPALEGWPLLAGIVRRYLYHKHIANASLILGPIQRLRLGIPLWAVPWYPVLSAPLRFLRISWYRCLGEKAFEKFTERCARKQERLLASYFEDREARIIQPTREHPAHVG